MVGSLWPSLASADVRSDARQHFRRGMALIAEGNIDEGIAELEAAYDILPHPNALYNIARAYAESGRYQDAIDYFTRYLESDPVDREEVEGFVAALRERMAASSGRTEVAETTEAEVTETEGSDEADGAAVASEEEIAALEDSATQIDALAEAAQSDELRRRADRLRELAATLRSRRAGTGGGAPEVGDEEGARIEPELGDAGTPEGGAALSLGSTEERDEAYDESVVSSSRVAESPLDAPNSTALVTAQDLRLSGYTEPALALRRVAGVSLLSSDPANPQISIRGLNQRLSNRTIVLVDGRSVYLDFLGTTLWSLLPLNYEDIERIEIIRGPASALYGADAFTGVINVITRTLGEGGSYLSAGVGNGGTYRLAASASARVDRWRFRVSGGYTRTDNYAVEVPAGRSDYLPGPSNPTLGLERLFFNGEFSLRLDDGISIRGGTAIAAGSLAFQAIARLRQVYTENSLFAQSYIQLNTGFGLSARVFWNRFSAPDVTLTGLLEGGIADSQANTLPRSDMIDSEVLYANSFDLGGIENSFIVGVSYRFKEVEWSWLRDGLQTQHHGAVFLQDTLSFGDVVDVVLSARADLHPLLNVQVSPRGSVVIHPAEGNSIRISGGSAFRSPTFTESYVLVPQSTPLRGVGAFGSGNPSLNPERIVSIELGYMNQMTEYFSLELNGYYNLVFDQITLTQNQIFRLYDYVNGTSIAGADARYYDQYSAYILTTGLFENQPEQFQQLGGELGVRVYPVEGLDLYANYALHQTWPFGGAAGPFHDDMRTSTHMVNGGASYRAPFGLDVSVDFSWQSEQVWFEQLLDPVRGIVFGRFGLPSYAILNARIGYRLFEDQLELAVVGTNLIDDGHREHPYGQPIDRRFMGVVTVRF
jgi:outer membrane receptor for ferrienterochelin and colicin